MKGIDITDEVNSAKAVAVDPNDAWEGYVDFKAYRSSGVEAVIIEGRAYLCGKYGLGEEVPLSEVEVVK